MERFRENMSRRERDRREKRERQRDNLSLRSEENVAEVDGDAEKISERYAGAQGGVEKIRGNNLARDDRFPPPRCSTFSRKAENTRPGLLHPRSREAEEWFPKPFSKFPPASP